MGGAANSASRHPDSTSIRASALQPIAFISLSLDLVVTSRRPKLILEKDSSVQKLEHHSHSHKKDLLERVARWWKLLIYKRKYCFHLCGRRSKYWLEVHQEWPVVFYKLATKCQRRRFPSLSPLLSTRKNAPLVFLLLNTLTKSDFRLKFNTFCC